MPQLDKITFLSQYFWLLIFYIGFFLVIQKIYLPRFGRILLYREKKISAIDTNNIVSAASVRAVSGELFDQISGQISKELTDLLNNYFSRRGVATRGKLSATNKEGSQSVAEPRDGQQSRGVGVVSKFSQPLYNRYCDSFFELITKNRISIDPSTSHYGAETLIKNKSSPRYGNRHPFFYFFFKKTGVA